MASKGIPVAIFTLGRVVATPNVLSQVTNQDIQAAIKRHQAGDWGDLDEHDRVANDLALTDASRILSAYHTAKGVKFWIITEADRSVTTILLTEDY